MPRSRTAAAASSTGRFPAGRNGTERALRVAPAERDRRGLILRKLRRLFPTPLRHLRGRHSSPYRKRGWRRETSPPSCAAVNCRRNISKSWAKQSALELKRQQSLPAEKLSGAIWRARRDSRCTRRACRPGIIVYALEQVGFLKAPGHGRCFRWAIGASIWNCPGKGSDCIPKDEAIPASAYSF